MMPWRLLTNPVAIISIIISMILLTQPWITIQEPEITITKEPYSYEITAPVLVEHKYLLFFIPVVEAHQSIKNTDNFTGTFYVNFIFDNGVERKATLEDVTLIRGQQDIVSSTVYCFSGNVDVAVSVIPPDRFSRHTKLVNKQITFWEFLSRQFP